MVHDREKEAININCPCLALVAHAYNSSYSGGRDQEDRSLRPDWAKIPNTEKGWQEWLKRKSACLASVSKALSSIPSMKKTQPNRKDLAVCRMNFRVCFLKLTF
jgi:hypothetical protein